MFWSWLDTQGRALLAPVRNYLYGHSHLVFRALLLGGDFLCLILFWYMQQAFPYQRATVGLWLAGFTATLAALFIFTIGSARLNGYRLEQDSWIRLATIIMLLLCFALVGSALI